MKANACKKWTIQDLDRLKIAYRCGISTRQIAKDLERTEAAIDSKISSIRKTLEKDK